jgi:hemolysin III
MRWGPLAFIWVAAIVGAVLKTAYFDAVAEWVGLTLYLVMGWFGFVGGIVLCRRHGFAFVRPVLFGGVAFSLGALMDLFRWPVVVPGFIHAHDVFHLAVLVAYAFHFSFIWRIALVADGGADAVRPNDARQRSASPEPTPLTATAGLDSLAAVSRVGQ